MDTIVDRIRALAKEKKLSLTTLEQTLNMGNGTIGKWKTKTPSCDKIKLIADFLETTIDYLVSGTKKNPSQNNLSEDEQELINLYSQLNYDDRIRIQERAEVLLEQSKKKQLPYISNAQFKGNLRSKFIEMYDLPVSAGKGTYLTGDSKDLCAVKITDATIQASYALKVSGDSMDPLYTDGDILLIAVQESVDQGEIGIFIVNGSGYVKKYGGDRLISLNPSYDDIMINDYDTVYCKGKVIGKLDKDDVI